MPTFRAKIGIKKGQLLHRLDPTTFVRPANPHEDVCGVAANDAAPGGLVEVRKPITKRYLASHGMSPGEYVYESPKEPGAVRRWEKNHIRASAGQPPVPLGITVDYALPGHPVTVDLQEYVADSPAPPIGENCRCDVVVVDDPIITVTKLSTVRGMTIHRVKEDRLPDDYIAEKRRRIEEEHMRLEMERIRANNWYNENKPGGEP